MNRRGTVGKVDPAGVLKCPWTSEDGITVTPPTRRDVERGKPYHRIIFYDGRGKRRFASGGRTFDDALKALPAIRQRIQSPLSRGSQGVPNLVQSFLADHGLSPRGWSPKHAAGQTWLMRHYVLPVWGALKCNEITTHLVKTLVLSAPTAGEQRRLRSAVSGLLKYGYAEDWISREPAHLLKTSNLRNRKAALYGDAEGQVHQADVPTHDEVGELAFALTKQECSQGWYSLLAMIPAYTGLRLGEVLALRKRDIDLNDRRIHVRRQVTEVNGKPVFGPPKRGSARTTVIPRTLPQSARYPDGYPLLEVLRERIAQLTEDEQLLFPSPRGRNWRRSNFSRRLFIPAAKAAGWRTTPDGDIQLKYHSLRHRFCTWMLWDRGKSPQDVAVVAGHKNVAVTLKIYSGSDGLALERIDED